MTQKWLSLVGTRPQFVKAAVVDLELKHRGFSHQILSTGQHYDARMAGDILAELDLEPIMLSLPKNSNALSRLYAMTEQIKTWLADKHFDRILVYGDCDSTLAAAMACRSLAKPFVHVEAGVRVHRPTPEEHNRFLTDHLAAANVAFDEASLNNLKSENLQNSFLIPDVMQEMMALSWPKRVVPADFPKNKPVLFVTLHRDHNVDAKDTLENVIASLKRTTDQGWQVYWPLHPRTQARLDEFAIELPAAITSVPPLTYLETLGALSQSQAVLTDSGGLQREAAWAGLPVYLFLDYVVWSVGQNVTPQQIPEVLKEGSASVVGDCQAARSLVDQLDSL